MLTRENVYTETELRAHYEIKLDTYNKTVSIEAATMNDMVTRQILPAVSAYAGEVADCALKKNALLPGRKTVYEERLSEKLAGITEAIDEKNNALSVILEEVRRTEDAAAKAALIRDRLIPAMDSLRLVCDSAETLTARDFWPFPTYAELLFGVY